MQTIVFRYKRGPFGSTNIKRPVADIFLKTQDSEWLEFHPFIDSGADLTMVPLSFGRLLGWETLGAKINEIGGVRGSVPVIYQKTDAKIGEHEFSIKIAWALIEEVPPLLGRTDIFDRFEITFKQMQGIVIFSS